MKEKEQYTFEDLCRTVQVLRSEHGCPWDRVQTHESMKKYLEEECGEVLEAIDSQDPDNLCEELGDVLYQIMMHSEMEKEKGNFSIEDVVDGICRKMIRRHPGVFSGEETAGNTGGAADWEEMKRRERKLREKERENRKKP